MLLLDARATKTMLRISCHILKQQFFYDTDGVSRFLTLFERIATDDLIKFEDHADQDTLDMIACDRATRLDFTIYFVSCNMHDILKHYLFFNDAELRIFESYIPKYAEVAKLK